MESHQCAACDEPATQRCSRCKRVWYCKVECQRWHWKHGGHKRECRAEEEVAAAAGHRPSPAARTTAASTSRPESGPASPGSPQQTVEKLLAEHKAFCVREGQELLLPLAAHLDSEDSQRWLMRSMMALTNERGSPDDEGDDDDDEYDAPDTVEDAKRTRAALVGLATHATTAAAAREVAKALLQSMQLSLHIRDVLDTAAVRDALVSLMHHATTDEAVQHVVSFIYFLTDRSPHHQTVLTTHAVRDALVLCAQRANSSDAAMFIGAVIGNIASQPRGAALFVTTAVRDAMVSLGMLATSQKAVQRVCGALYDLAKSVPPSNPGLFATAGVRDALVAMARQATSAENKQTWDMVLDHSALKWGEALGAVFDSGTSGAKTMSARDKAQRGAIFGTAAVRDAIVSLAPLADKDGSMICLVAAFHWIALSGPPQPTLFQTDAPRQAMLAMCRRASREVAMELEGFVKRACGGPTTTMFW